MANSKLSFDDVVSHVVNEHLQVTSEALDLYLKALIDDISRILSHVSSICDDLRSYPADQPNPPPWVRNSCSLEDNHNA